MIRARPHKIGEPVTLICRGRCPKCGAIPLQVLAAQGR